LNKLLKSNLAKWLFQIEFLEQVAPPSYPSSYLVIVATLFIQETHL